jgi:uncharacterized membrane protein (DUF4010 family)
MDSYLIRTTDFEVSQLDFAIRLLVAAGIGLLIGLEREYAAMRSGEQIFAGIRTFVLLSLTGFAGAALHVLFSPWIFVAILIGAMALVAMSYWITAKLGDIGGTSELAAILVLMLGAATFLGHIQEVLMVTVILLLILSAKLKLHFVVGQITTDEMYALLRFVVMALLIFPFLPDDNYGPYGTLNPREIGLVVLMISGLGFVGYTLMRVFGAGRGTLLTGIIGGLVSSTLVTWVLSRKSRTPASPDSLYASAILAASAIMIGRVLLWVFLFNKDILAALVLPVTLMLAFAAVMAWLAYRQNDIAGNDKTRIPLGKPLELTQAFFFALLYSAIVVIIPYADAYWGKGGILVTSGLAGLTDVDAITISLSKTSSLSIPVQVARNAILIAVMVNTVVKFMIAFFAGSPGLRRRLAIGYGVVLAAGIAGLLMVR